MHIKENFRLQFQMPNWTDIIICVHTTFTEKEEQRRKLTPTVMTASFKNWSMFTENLALLKYCLCSNWWERVANSPHAKNSMAKLGYSQIKIDRKIYHFTADSLIKGAVITVGVSLRLCLLSLWLHYNLFIVCTSLSSLTNIIFHQIKAGECNVWNA